MIPQDIAHEPSWYESSARARIDGVLDPGSFTELLGPECRIMSPHLELFDLPPAFDDGMIIGSGRLHGAPVAIAAQEGQFMGGTFAEVSGAKLVGLLRAAAASAGSRQAVSAVLLLLDTGGVRLQEANAGELAVSETIRAVLAVRKASIPVIALIGGRAGAFGGGSLVASCCSRIVMTEQGRISVTGPEVIETNKGAEEFDSRDRALVWRVTGGRSRALLGGADRYIRGDVASFRTAASDRADPPAFDVETMLAEQARLEKRLERFGDCHDTPEIWARMNLPGPAEISEIDDAVFIERLAATGGAHDAR